jgi:hypothetical protein
MTTILDDARAAARPPKRMVGGSKTVRGGSDTFRAIIRR